MSTTVRIVKDTKGAGFEDVKRRLMFLNRSVLVGVPSGTKEPDGTSTAMIAAVHEFGSTIAPHSRVKRQVLRFNAAQYAKGRFVFAKAGKTAILVRAKNATFANGITIPARPFLRPGIRRNLKTFAALGRRDVRLVARGTMAGVMALDRLGVVAAGKVKEEITKGSFVPLAASTIRRKKSSKPLIDTGSLRQSITHVIDSGPRGRR